MAKFCTKCGRPLVEGKKCTHCQRAGFSEFLARILKRTGIGTPSENSDSMFETGQKIVPDIVAANGGEIPIKQYLVASLRSRIRGQYAKGRLQVTNKRVIFRAAGVSYQGPIAQQYEFAIGEIAGVEIKKKNRVSVMNVLACIFLNYISLEAFSELFSSFAEKGPTTALYASIVIAFVCAAPFFMLYKKFWLKLLLLNCGIGALVGTTNLTKDYISFLDKAPSAGLTEVILLVLYLLWFITVVLVSVVPDLVLVIKTKGAAPAFEIRRKLFPNPFRPMVEYTDFAEVLPGTDVDFMTSELGALIDDIQTLGDMAIEKWKE